MDRWQLYELLKGRCLTTEALQKVEKMPNKELKEGVLEYLLAKLHG